MATVPQRYIQIDPEGYWVSEGLRITDEEYGRSLFEKLHFGPANELLVDVDGFSVIVEAFDDPIVIRTISRAGDQLIGHGAYNWNIPIQLERITVDEWDRFHGRTDSGISFVLSRAAQAHLFETVDEYGDDWLSFNGRRYETKPWLESSPTGEVPGFWSKIYQEETPRWDLGKESPVLPAILPQLKQPRSRVLVFGCGSGHDAAFFARAGHIVTGVDFSDEAITRAHKLYGGVKDLRFVKSDVFKLPAEMRGQFDIAFDHTCYCAVSPERRNDLVQAWERALIPNGHLLGIFFARDKTVGPPWGGTEWEVRERLRKRFDLQYWTRWRGSVPHRQGTELVVWAQKKS